ncbi:MAG TPA: MoxR family ATPase, partial [Flavobacteriales bacterium]|nr:MoxR family ATPase [Flavobacteriales bacterium]
MKQSRLLDITTNSYDGSPEYIPSDELKNAVDLAIRLGRPLLLQGDPGCGKTALAYSVAAALNLPLEESYIKSTSRAQDLLYTYDAIKRLYDSQMGDKGPKDVQGVLLSQNVRNYIHYGPLGRAIMNSQKRDAKKSVVLIDEIDKADLDFPNDLLFELDRLAFQVTEVEELRYAVPNDRPDLRPIVIITHNEEKALPPAFLRRCIYFYVEM